MADRHDPRSSGDSQGRPARPRTLRQATGAILPTLATLGNLVCGFGAIYCAARGAGAGEFIAGHGPAAGEHGARIYAELTYFTVGGWLIFLAMVFDAVDGGLARITRSTSDLGAQLDSLADVVSFGVAPAFLMLMMVGHYVAGEWFRDHWLIGTDQASRIAVRAVWVVAALYASCTALRLARFNVETEEDESAHIWFKGLPSPGAAAAVASLTILLEQSAARYLDHPGFGWAVRLVFWMLPAIALAVGLMMVTNVPYPHAINRFARGRHPFRNVVLAVLLVACVVVGRQFTLAVCSVGYALSGPTLLFWRRVIRKDFRTPDELAAALIQDENDE